MDTNIKTMKRILTALTIIILLSSCQSNHKKDIALIGDFYEHVLGNKPMTDEYLQSILSDDILKSIWEADYEDTYSFWVFRTGFQDGPSNESSVKSIESIGKNWYRVTYSDMGNPGTTDVQVQSDKICAYKSQNNIE